MSLDQDEIRTLAVRMSGRAMRSYDRIRRKQRWWRFSMSLLSMALAQMWWLIEPHLPRHTAIAGWGGAFVILIVFTVVWLIGDRALEAKWRGWKRHADELWDRYEQARKRARVDGWSNNE